eukprot:CAMPEP_0115471192 /NCGR_PEP_ID=MMETSP0271-20121206/52396_1 /TAXON_ID=71861 /ORGANISM="Scrippsiella trochoidea, Strain CCMP3099" /LENGTH=73 /DNA_ID=CAMNT_0002898369 /DNA_START=110 /DNA_END=331 /DNA_ORIENTATION=+
MTAEISREVAESATKYPFSRQHACCSYRPSELWKPPWDLNKTKIRMHTIKLFGISRLIVVIHLKEHVADGLIY